jgi:DNA-binding response OmpR family regulator
LVLSRARGSAVDRPPILVVDEDRRSREGVSTLLQEAGYATREAATGMEALTSARDVPPAAVVLDVVLPDLAGYDVCHTLREEFGEELPIIFVSGTRTEPLDRVAGLLMGADDYVVKPFAPEELVARVRRSLQRLSSLDTSARRRHGSAAA